MAFYQFHCEQRIPASKKEVWEFMRAPENLERITPDGMSFDIISTQQSNVMYPGMIIAYKVAPVLNIKMTWVTEITHVKDEEYFVDEQRQGPYKMWHHEHKIYEIEGGTMMEDLITYSPPFGLIGRIANRIFIRKQIENIFEYRRKAVVEIFGPFEKEET